MFSELFHRRKKQVVEKPLGIADRWISPKDELPAIGVRVAVIERKGVGASWDYNTLVYRGGRGGWQTTDRREAESPLYWCYYPERVSHKRATA